MAGALKVKTDWVPWRGFDGATSGPLTAYTLALPALFGARIDFFSARFLGVCLLTLTLGGLYFAVKWLNGGRVARLALLPPVLLLALTKDWNFLHFSSETVPILLTTTVLAASAYLARETRPKRRRIAACAIAGVCLGSAGLAKLQSLPIAFCAARICRYRNCFSRWPSLERRNPGSAYLRRVARTCSRDRDHLALRDGRVALRDSLVSAKLCQLRR